MNTMVDIGSNAKREIEDIPQSMDPRYYAEAGRAMNE